MALKTILVCDSCGQEVPDGKGAVMRLNFNDLRRGSKVAEYCDDCAGRLPGRQEKRRGRRPKTAAA